MDAGNEGDDARVQQGEFRLIHEQGKLMDDTAADIVILHAGDEQPRTKRKLSRLSHMAVNKPAGGDQELHHKSSAAAAGFGSAAKARESGERRDSDLADASDDAIADPDTLSPAAGPSLRHRATQGSIQNAAVIAATEPADALQSEPPIVAAKGHPQPSQQQHPSETAAGTAASTAAQEASNQPHRVNLDDEEDDEWEDQPAPLVIQAADGGFEGSAEGRGAEADIQQQEADEAAATAAEYDPSSRRRAVYDDEDEWEDLVMKEKVKGQYCHLQLGSPQASPLKHKTAATCDAHKSSWQPAAAAVWRRAACCVHSSLLMHLPTSVLTPIATPSHVSTTTLQEARRVPLHRMRQRMSSRSRRPTVAVGKKTKIAF